MDEEKKPEPTSGAPRPTTKAGTLSYIAKQYQAVKALYDPDDPEHVAYLKRLDEILTAEEAREAAK